jgi:hypothetical protein
MTDTLKCEHCGADRTGLKHDEPFRDCGQPGPAALEVDNPITGTEEVFVEQPKTYEQHGGAV